jgi:hypothetical protein
VGHRAPGARYSESTREADRVAAVPPTPGWRVADVFGAEFLVSPVACARTAQASSAGRISNCGLSVMGSSRSTWPRDGRRPRAKIRAVRAPGQVGAS